MNDPAVILLGWVALMSVAGFVLMGVDKYRARRDMWRIPEKTLFTCALLGGTPGVILGMNRFRHKTKHWYFRYGLPALLTLQLALLGWTGVRMSG